LLLSTTKYTMKLVLHLLSAALFVHAAPSSNTTTSGWVQTNGVDFTPNFSGGILAEEDNVTSFGDCIQYGASLKGWYVSYQGRNCKVISTTYSYSMNSSVTSAARYNPSDYTCAGNAEYAGFDVEHFDTRFERCLDSCKNKYDATLSCNAVTWVRNPGTEYGTCFQKRLQDVNAAPQNNTFGGIACKIRIPTKLPQGWVQVQDVQYKPLPNAMSSKSNFSTFEQCATYADSVMGSFVNYKAGNCSIIYASSSYDMNVGGQAAVRYDPKQFRCVGNAAYNNTSDSIKKTGDFGACLKICQEASTCDVVSWSVDPQSEKGSCILKKVTGSSQNPDKNSRGAIACTKVVS